MRGGSPSPFGDAVRDEGENADLVAIRAARPPDVTPDGMRDPWHVRGWRTGTLAGMLRGLALGVASLVACAPFVTGYVAEELSRAADERARYVEATGVVEPGGLSGVLAVSDPVHGSVDVMLRHFETLGTSGGDLDIGDRVTVLVDRDDPTDYRLSRACPACAGGVAAGWALLIAGTTTALVVLHRRRPLDAAAVRYVAVPVATRDAPPPPRRPRRVVGTVLVAATAAALLGAGGTALEYGLTHGPERERATVDGVVTKDYTGAYSVYFDDARVQRKWERPMSSSEVARAAGGPTLPVTYVLDPDAHTWGPLVGWTTAGGMLLAGGLLLAGRDVRRRLLLRRALASPARPEQVTAWTRVVLGLPVLVVARPGANGVRDVLAIPLARGVRLPASIDGWIPVHGDLRRGGVAVLRDPQGGALWPLGRVRGALAATLLGPDPAAPEPPLRGYGTAWTYDYIDG